MRRKSRTVPVHLTKTELISVRRFLNRAIEDCESGLRGYTMPVWYYLRFPLRKIDEALQELEKSYAD